MNQDYSINTLTQLRKIIPDYPKMMDKRIKDSLDSYSQEFLQNASLAIFSSSIMKHVGIIAFNTVRLRVHKATVLQLELPWPLSDGMQKPAGKTACSLYCLIAGIGHGLRINGELRILRHSPDQPVHLEIHIRQVYFHCSRAIVRANFWQPDPHPLRHATESQHEAHEVLDTVSQNFIRHSPLAFICSRNADGNLEISPRGDEPGFVKIRPDRSLLIPERPGNKVAITLRNILEQPTIQVLFLAPQQNRVLQLSGRASVSNRPEYLQQLIINNKAPKLAIVLEIDDYQLNDCQSLTRADIWNRSHYRRPDEFNSFAKIMNAHLHGDSLIAKSLQPVVSAVIKHDLRHLY